MDIPAFFAASMDRRTVCVDSVFNGMSPTPSSGTVPLQDISDRIRGEVRAPVVAIDHVSLVKRSFDASLTKHLRIRGTEPWLMTHIRTVDDVFDAFNGSADMLLAPLHGLESRMELKDIQSVSDSFVPVVYCIGSKSVGIRGIRSGISEELEGLVDIGLYRACVMDCDGSIGSDTWEGLAEEYPSTIPFVTDASRTVSGFENRVSIIPL